MGIKGRKLYLKKNISNRKKSITFYLWRKDFHTTMLLEVQRQNKKIKIFKKGAEIFFYLSEIGVGASIMVILIVRIVIADICSVQELC